MDAEVETGLIYVRHKNPVKAALELKTSYLVSFYKFTHTADVQIAHKNGLKIIVWTVNEPDEVAEYAKKGVDGIASDKPDVLTQYANLISRWKCGFGFLSVLFRK